MGPPGELSFRAVNTSTPSSVTRSLCSAVDYLDYTHCHFEEYVTNIVGLVRICMVALVIDGNVELENVAVEQNPLV